MPRPSDYTDELADLICQRIVAGESLRAICREDGMPDRTTVSRWMAAREEFAAKCARARDEQADTLVEEMVEIADAATTGEEAQVAKVRIAARQWFASKVAPKKYGDRVQHTGTGPNGEIAHEVAVKVSFE